MAEPAPDPGTPWPGASLGTMRRTSIRTKLVLLLAIPLLVLVVVAGLGVSWTSDAAARSEATSRGSELALASTRAALEASRERALTAATVAGATGASANELRFQRGQTDAALTHLDATLDGLGDDDGLVDDVAAALATSRSEADADAGGGGVETTLTDYTAVVDRLLTAGAAGVAGVDDADLGRAAQAYAALTRLTDAVAHQQSALTPAFAAGRLDVALRDRATAAVALEAAWRAQFEQGADAAQRALLAGALRSPSVRAADRIRDAALASPAGSPTADDGDLWMSSSTRKVDLLAGVGDTVATDLQAAATAARADAQRTRVLLLALGAAALALIAALLVLLHRIVIGPVRRLTSAAHDIAHDVLPRAVEVAHSSGPDAADDVARPVPATSPDELGALAGALDELQRTAVGLAAEQATLRRNVNDVFLNLGRRTQNLITRQLEQIDHLEDRTEDPTTLADLFRLDHLSTRLRRNAENMLVLAGAESPRPWARPVSVASVVRAALAESTDYSRVDIPRLEPAAVLGAVVSDVSHLLAELIDNALAFSPPTERVVVTGRRLAGGAYGVAVEDAGLGMPSDRLAQANARIAEPPVDDFAVSRFLGLYVVGRLASRHGITATLTDSRLGGINAGVVLPAALLVGDHEAPATPAWARPAPAYERQPTLAGGPDA